MIELSASDIAGATGGTLSATASPGSTVDAATTDSREAAPGALFIAKPGERVDGHDFIPAARAAGATLVLAERETLDAEGRPDPAVIVDDVVLAMGRLASHVVQRIREHSPTTVIGITGSAGKTTTKDLLAGVLATDGPTVAPQGSYNGEVGVPLTVFRAALDTRYLVVEMGADRIGNIEYLASMVKPDIGVVLMVGSAHAGSFGGVENIARTKGELVEALPADGVAVLNRDDARVAAMAGRTGARVAWFATEDAAFPLVDADVASGAAAFSALTTGLTTTEDERPAFELRLGAGTAAEGHPVVSGLIGRHHAANIAAAAAAAFAAGLPAERIAAALDGTGPTSRRRMERTDRPDGVTIINDAYNANPESMRAALRTLAMIGRSTGRRTWAVLGEMLELGEARIAEHTAIGTAVVRLNIDQLVVVGRGARPLYTSAVNEGSWGEEIDFAEDVEAARELLERRLAPGDVVLVKSSNGAGLGELGDRLAAAGAATAGAADGELARTGDRTEGRP
ncbi:UDP-N-acetylmuramoyl-tripeptide--D-alanyl-D-alanine ligase [Citricoccus sp. SGAir0253]|uniref:UDP-N-acetylmuramoyl-tripeptide--D-alanyl-D- alanine ligase n=1 Tax=Citricoccus sp. SGAir0253 TaxID=2567881 RepID=UPI0010CD1AF2|nr:UDP-N-acetylmuramoyl-tripeptide--D-alanyl-D-alanine ligase [Citricoccus sp. SGAir0253]QCU77836.1 UDP-N-acetylmuramoyl-tripeptide--D-alanyl-D-alanine ligase [Citricoccus sp. SGAir0253]